MPGLDRKLDPRTGDYIRDGSGGHEYTKTIETAAIHQLKGRRDQWFGDPDAGSYLYQLTELNLTDATLDLAEEFSKQALQVFVDDGRARDLESIATVATSPVSRLLLKNRITDVQFGDVILDDLGVDDAQLR